MDYKMLHCHQIPLKIQAVRDYIAIFSIFFGAKCNNDSLVKFTTTALLLAHSEWENLVDPQNWQRPDIAELYVCVIMYKSGFPEVNTYKILAHKKIMVFRNNIVCTATNGRSNIWICM